MKFVILLSTMSLILNCQGQNKLNQKNNSIAQEDTIMIDRNNIEIEYYDFQTTQNGTQSVIYEKDNGWLVDISAMKNMNYGYCTEYAPSVEFYEIQKTYHLNGIVKGRGKFMSNVAFGRREYFDENGNCIKIVDEDKKFGAITPQDIIKLLEKEGWFDRQTGKNIITNDSILPTNYRFYREIMQYINITFKRSVINKQGEEIEPPKWFIKINPRHKRDITQYIIDGRTGKFEKKETFEPLEI